MHKVYRLAVLTASSCGGLGYLPLAPGTWGSLGGLALWFLMRELDWPIFLAWSAVAVVVAIGIAHLAEQLYQEHDTGHIVIDEVVGMLLTVVGVPWRLHWVLTAFVLFRLLDAFKPWPICLLDKHVSGGLGVVLDDVAAGLIGCAILHAMNLYLGGW